MTSPAISASVKKNVAAGRQPQRHHSTAPPPRRTTRAPATRRHHHQDEPPEGAIEAPEDLTARHDGAQHSLKLENRGLTSHGAEEATQRELWNELYAFSETIVAKLRSIGRRDLSERLADCHSQELSITCRRCYAVKVVRNRCERRWCPICVRRLARQRKEELDFWINGLKQPKHVVLTARNQALLRRDRVKAFTAALRRLRNQAWWKRRVSSGLWSIEVTNEGRGWHLHAHLLVEARFVPADELARAWAKLIGQDFAIVKVKDCRKADYLQEVSKYVVKSSMLAGWPAEDIAALIDTMSGIRSFGVFGTLSGQRQQWKMMIKEARRLRSKCQCGACDWQVEDERLTHLQQRHRK